MLTASHNPPQYNGLKLLNPDGSAFSAEQQKQIEDLINGASPLSKSMGQNAVPAKSTAPPWKSMSHAFNRTFPGGIKLKVVVDSGGGAAYFITAHLLNQLGCEVTSLNGYPDGIFPHDVEPVEANLGDLMRPVKETGADLGIAHDGDADRMMAVDDLGRFISGDKMLAILAQACRLKISLPLSMPPCLSRKCISASGGPRWGTLMFRKN